MVALPFPAANKTINFVFDTLRRTTLITPAARDALGVLDGPESRGGLQPDLGESVELPAARIGHEWGDHFRVAMDAVVANPEQASTRVSRPDGLLTAVNRNSHQRMSYSSRKNMFLLRLTVGGMINAFFSSADWSMDENGSV